MTALLAIRSSEPDIQTTINHNGIRAQHSMNRRFAPLPIRPAGLPGHHIDNLERTITSDTVDIEVKADSTCCLRPDIAS
jgi:hypothetical protein